MKRVFFSFFLLFLVKSLSAQEYLGTWTSHLPYNNSIGVAIAQNRIFCATEGGLFYYNKEDKSINKLSREDGLSDTEISTLAYNESSSVLLITYKNANIDILTGNTVFNLPDIKRKQILGDKNIYHIYFRDKLAYLSCGFGIVVLDTEGKEIRETYYIGEEGSRLKINAVTGFNNYLYAATDEGLYYADLNVSNLADFNNWQKLARFNRNTQSITSIVSGPEAIYLILDHLNSETDSLYQFKNNQWELYPYFQDENLISLNYDNDQLIVCSRFNIDILSREGELNKHLYVGRPVFGEIDDNNTLWIADRDKGLIENPNSWEKKLITPEGPAGINTADLEYKNGLLLGAAGGTSLGLGNLYRNAQVYMYNNQRWSGIKIDSLKDLITLAIDPTDTSHFFAGSWGYGLLEYREGKLVNHYTDKNSTLQTIIPNDFFFRLGGITFDNNRNLWVTNSGVAEPLSVLTSEGDWISFPIASQVSSPHMGKIIITQQNHKWIVLPGGNGLFVFDHNGTLENHDDDEMKKVSVIDENNKVITNEIYAIAEDRKGNIWLGTNLGILVFYSPSRVFSGENFYAQKIIVPRNDGSGLGDPLLGTETVTCIEVDGANRKWIGTRNGGVFLVSEDGLEEIHAFNTNNSPLLSNSITDIAINEDNGEVFIATNNGIISFISDATEPDEFFKDVYVYPNPVRQDYTGNIIVSGMVEDTYVKITDLNGNLVHETKSLGGQAVWDGRNLSGERVATGVYLVFCTNDDGSKTHVTKLLFIH